MTAPSDVSRRAAIVRHRLRRGAGDTGRPAPALCALIQHDSDAPVVIYRSERAAYAAARAMCWQAGTYTVRPAEIAGF